MEENQSQESIPEKVSMSDAVKQSPKFKKYWENRPINYRTGRKLKSSFHAMRSSRLSPKLLAVQERDSEALEMRRNGYSMQQIVDELGYATKGHLQQQLKKTLERANIKEVEEYRNEISSKYELLLMALEERAFNGEIDSAKEYRETIKDLRKLLNIDVQTHKTSTNVNISSKDICKLAFPNATPIPVEPIEVETVEPGDGDS